MKIKINFKNLTLMNWNEYLKCFQGQYSFDEGVKSLNRLWKRYENALANKTQADANAILLTYLKNRYLKSGGLFVHFKGCLSFLKHKGIEYLANC